MSPVCFGPDPSCNQTFYKQPGTPLNGPGLTFSYSFQLFAFFQASHSFLVN